MRNYISDPASVGVLLLIVEIGHPWPAVKVSIFPQLHHPIASYLASRMERGKIGADRISLRR